MGPQPKKELIPKQSTSLIHPAALDRDGKDFITYPDPGGTQASRHPTRGLSLLDKHDQHQGLEGR
jgi:hypothetical protein